MWMDPKTNPKCTQEELLVRAGEQNSLLTSSWKVLVRAINCSFEHWWLEPPVPFCFFYSFKAITMLLGCLVQGIYNLLHSLIIHHSSCLLIFVFKCLYQYAHYFMYLITILNTIFTTHLITHLIHP